VGSSVTGRGANLLIIDDPFTESCVAQPKVFDDVWEYYLAGPRQRLMPGGNILVVQTRWSVKDLTGRLLREQSKNPKADQWEVIEFPAVLPKSGKPLWPEFWTADALEKVKHSLDARHWNSEWLQNPTATEGAIVKKEWWMEWPSQTPPSCSYIIQSYDTAYSKRETADYSVVSTWGVFYPEGDYERKSGEKRSYDGREAHVILLDVVRDRFEFPELKDEAYRLYSYWKPDTVVVEAKGSGGPLAQEMRARGIPVQEYSPGKRKGGGGQDKITRLHSVSDFFRSGMVWAPDELWSREMIDEVQAFPAGDHDDQVDSMTMALMRFREGNFLQLNSDEDPSAEWRPRRKMKYY
jgi:predicted phage terminase large subunit-like protein